MFCKGFSDETLTSSMFLEIRSAVVRISLVVSLCGNLCGPFVYCSPRGILLPIRIFVSCSAVLKIIYCLVNRVILNVLVALVVACFCSVSVSETTKLIRFARKSRLRIGYVDHVYLCSGLFVECKTEPFCVFVYSALQKI